MIKFCIIEDEESQFDRIEKNITIRLKELGLRNNFLWSIDGIKCWNHELDEFEKIYEGIDPDIIILDYDLYWGENRKSFDGDKIFEKIFTNESILKPFVIFTSLKFSKEKKGFPVSIVEGGTTTEYYDTSNKSEFLDLMFKNKIDKSLLKAIERVLKIRPQIYLKLYNHPESYVNKNNFVKPKNIDKVLLYQRNVICFSTSDDQRAIIFILDDDCNIYIRLLDEGRKETKKVILKKFKDHYFHKLEFDTLVYNSEFIKKSGNNQFILNANKIDIESIYKFRDLVNTEIKFVDSELTKPENRSDNISINPFYKIFKRFNFSEVW